MADDEENVSKSGKASGQPNSGVSNNANGNANYMEHLRIPPRQLDGQLFLGSRGRSPMQPNPGQRLPQRRLWIAADVLPGRGGGGSNIFSIGDVVGVAVTTAPAPLRGDDLDRLNCRAVGVPFLRETVRDRL